MSSFTFTVSNVSGIVTAVDAFDIVIAEPTPGQPPVPSNPGDIGEVLDGTVQEDVTFPARRSSR